jgi:uncharacterized membrane protein HdeD (DUF308 family)
MPQPSPELSRTSFVLLLRGFFLIVLGAVAVRWPEQTLVLAIVAAGGIAGTLGIFEVATAAATEMLPSSRMFYLGHGLVFVAFGVLSASVHVATVSVATTLAIIWLTLYVAYALLLAARVWYLSPARAGLLAWAFINTACAIATARFPARTTVGLLYWGALYVAVLGVAQVVAGTWIKRHALSPTRRASVAAPAGASTATERQTVL